jgi:hypothetical protein
MDKLIIDNFVTYNSAGVMPIYKNNFVIFRSSQTDDNFDFQCDIAGGGIDQKDISLEETANRELFEETIKLFNFKPSTLKYARSLGSFVDIPGRTIVGKRYPGKFGCYFIKLDNCSLEDYYINKKYSKKYKLPKYYNETNEIILIPINTMVEFFKNNNKPYQYAFIKDRFNKYRKITLLSLYCMYKYIEQYIFPFEIDLKKTENNGFITYNG